MFIDLQKVHKEMLCLFGR